MRISLISLTAITVALLAGCGKSEKTESQDDAFKPSSTTGHNPHALGPFDYDLTGKNDKDEACSTGVKKFETLHLMCINIQDPVQNNNCALSERIHKFVQDCSPKGYDFFESHECRVSLLDKAAEVSVFGEYDKKYLVRSVEYCTGRTPGGTTMGGISENFWLHDDIMMQVSMNFAPRKDANSSYQSSFRLRMIKQPRSGPRVELIEEFNYRSGAALQSGAFTDGSYKYLIQCGNTWACTDSTQP
jgi:hypothetical protein